VSGPRRSPQRADQIVEANDRIAAALEVLIKDVTDEEKQLCRAFFYAMQFVAVVGVEHLSCKDAAARILQWARRRTRTWEQGQKEAKVRRAVKESTRAKVRDPKRGESGFEDGSKAVGGVSPRAAERYTYKKKT
jgi:hypothetical protein